MTLGATFQLAFRALRRNKLRSGLTMLGIIIGVGAVIAVFGIGNGAKSQVEAQIATLGENMILIFSGSMNAGGVHSGWGSSGTLKVEDAQAIARELPAVTGVSPEIRSNGADHRGQPELVHDASWARRRSTSICASGR